MNGILSWNVWSSPLVSEWRTRLSLYRGMLWRVVRTCSSLFSSSRSCIFSSSSSCVCLFCVSWTCSWARSCPISSSRSTCWSWSWSSCSVTAASWKYTRSDQKHKKKHVTPTQKVHRISQKVVHQDKWSFLILRWILIGWRGIKLSSDWLRNNQNCLLIGYRGIKLSSDWLKRNQTVFWLAVEESNSFWWLKMDI